MDRRFDRVEFKAMDEVAHIVIKYNFVLLIFLIYLLSTYVSYLQVSVVMC